MRRHIWGYAVCLCPTKRMPGLYELKELTSNLVVYINGIFTSLKFQNVTQNMYTYALNSDDGIVA